MNKKRTGKFLMAAAHLLLVAVILLLLCSSAGYRTGGPSPAGVLSLDTALASVNGGPARRVTLPHSFEKLSPRTPVALEFRFSPEANDALYLKSVYSPARVYLDGELIWEFGRAENYPSFMKDPATEVQIVETPGSGEEKRLRLEYLSPISRSTLTVHPPLAGSSRELIAQRQQHLGIPLSFSFIQAFVGLSLMLIAGYLMLLDKKAVIFFWLGLFALSSGVWAFGENNFALMLYKNTAAMYLISFIGFFSFMGPLFHFVRIIVDFEKPAVLWIAELFMTLCAAGALLLQLTGVMACSRSMYFFHMLLPLNLLMLALLDIFEAFYYGSLNARRLALPLSVLSLSAFMELFNYSFPVTYIFSSIFQAGIMFFLLCMGIIGGLYVKDSRDLQNREKELAFQKSLLAMQTEEQKESSLLLAHNEQLLSQQRHDLRHHIAALQQLAGDNRELQDYLSALNGRIPEARERFCENSVVNAVVSHYYTLCGEQGIDFCCRLAVPVTDDSARDSELCVIFANLLENAAEACGRMSEGKKFIHLQSSLQYELLSITMDNSFSGSVKTEGGRFRSAKRNDYGIGIASITAVAEKTGGSAEFSCKDNVFCSSVLVQL